MKMKTELPEQSKTSINIKDDVISPVIETPNSLKVCNCKHDDKDEYMDFGSKQMKCSWCQGYIKELYNKMPWHGSL